MRHTGRFWSSPAPDRIAANSDTANKVGTTSGARRPRRQVPFHIAAPHSTLDFALRRRRPAIDRGPRRRRIHHVRGGSRTAPSPRSPRESRAANPAFDLTPAR